MAQSSLRASSLLNVRKSSKATMPITAANATSSPFLKLPPEIRNRIYRYILGGCTLHVFEQRTNGPTATSTFHHRICADEVSVEGAAAMFKVKAGADEPITGLSKAQHVNCISTIYPVGSAKLNPQLSLGLLRACRQIYADASLIPYVENTFAFHNMPGDWTGRDSLAVFVKSLIPAQRKSIQKLSFIIKAPDRGNTIFPTIRKGTIRALKGLRSLHIQEECSDRILTNSFINSRHDMGLNKVWELFEAFQKLPLTSVSVRVFSPTLPVPMKLKNGCEALEQRLLEPWDEAAYQEMLEAERAAEEAEAARAKDVINQESLANRKGRGLRGITRKSYY